MSPIEVRRVSPEEMIGEIEASVKLQRENKYSFQVGLKDVDFDVNQELLEAKGLILPFQSLQQAERALNEGGIAPVKLIEFDDTVHEVVEFDPRPVGFSGFMDCVTHSLALTNQGLFEVGRYPAINLASGGRFWQWFLHRRWATPEEIAQIQGSYLWSSQELLAYTYQAITGVSREAPKEENDP